MRMRAVRAAAKGDTDEARWLLALALGLRCRGALPRVGRPRRVSAHDPTSAEIREDGLSLVEYVKNDVGYRTITMP